VLYLPEIEQAPDSGKLWNANFIYLLFLNTMTQSAFMMVNPIMSMYVVSLGGSLALGGLVVGMLPITALFARPISGAVADNFNKKTALFVSTVAMAVIALFHIFIVNPGVLVFIRILHGLAFALMNTTNTAFAIMYIPKHRMGEGVGYLGFSIVLATAIGPGIGLWVVDTFGYHTDFIASFVAGMISAALVLLVRYKPEKKEGPKARLKLHMADFIDVKLVPIAILGGLFTFSVSTINSFIAMMGDNRGIANIGIYFIINSIMLLAIRPVSGKLNDKRGLAVILIPSYILSGVAMCILGTAQNLWIVIISAVLMGIGYGAGSPALQAEGIRLLPEKPGVASSTFLIGLDTGHGLGAVVGGAVLGSFGFGAMFAVPGVLLFLGMIAYMLYRKREKC